MTLDGSNFSSCSKRKIKHVLFIIYILFSWLKCCSRPRPLHCSGFAITLRHNTVSGTRTGERSHRYRDPYLTTHNTHNRHTPIPPAVFEPAIPASERPQTHALTRAAAGFGLIIHIPRVCLCVGRGGNCLL
jgi:hypothetical protein